MQKTKKNNKFKYKLLILGLVLVLFVIDYPILNKAISNWLVDYETGIVERVIDGDTVVVNGSSVRMLGINSPERGEKYYGEAKTFLESLTLNKLVKMRSGKEDIDLYKRKLRYIFVDNENVNKLIVQRGLANFYFPSGKDKYYNSFFEAWGRCMSDERNLCQSSKDVCSTCITLKNWDTKGQSVIFSNKCGMKCELTGWTIKDEGRKKFIFPNFVLNSNSEVEIKVGDGNNTNKVSYWSGEEYVWTETGDSIILRDSAGGLILFKSY